MSRRRGRAGRRPPQGGREAPQGGREAPRGGREAPRGGREAPRGAPGRRPPRISFLAQVGILVAVFALVSLIADLAGAANLGVALGIGSIAFSIALVAVIVKT